MAIAERFTIRLTAPEVQAGGTSTVKCPKGYKYHSFHVRHNGTLAHYPEFRIKADVQTVRRLSFAEQDTFNQFDGMAASGSNWLVIPIDQVGFRDRLGETETALNVTGRIPSLEAQGIQTIENLEIQFDIAGNATAPVLEVWAEVSVADMSAGAGTVRHIVKSSRDLAVGEIDILNLDYNKPNRAFLRRIAFQSADISKIEIYRNTQKVVERSRVLNTRIQADGYRVPSAASSWTIYDTGEKGYHVALLQLLGVADFYPRLTVTNAAAGCPVIVEYLGSLN